MGVKTRRGVGRGRRPGMVLVVSLNPAVDAEWMAEEVRPLEKNEVLSERRWPGGKGVNVVRWMRWMGQRGVLFVPVGGESGREFMRGMAREGLAGIPFRLKEATRVNVIVTPARGPQLRFNPIWPRFSAVERREVVALLKRVMKRHDPVVISGAMPRTMPVATYAGLVREGRRLGKRMIVDCDGRAFALAVREGPFLVKPNEIELAEWAGRPLGSEKEERKAVQQLSEAGGTWVLYSRGARGAWLVHAGLGAGWEATGDTIEVRNTVGAGDAVLAAACSAIENGLDPVEWLRLGMEAGRAATSVPPGCLPRRGTGRDGIRIRELGSLG